MGSLQVYGLSGICEGRMDEKQENEVGGAKEQKRRI